ncbi:MAG: hypothetical protein FJ087_19340, partial [Deltaproteobacteria bacterium]|nr:hypothetical protein [Deltaproteobacteria bacterium]
LNSLGTSILTWIALAALAAHLLAARTAGPAAPLRAGRLAAATAAALALAAAAGLLVPSAQAPAAPARDRTRLSVVVPGPGGAAAVQTVEEGSPYALPGAAGNRTLLFGATGAGPYALERAADGRLVAHLPAAGPGDQGAIRVLARRPAAIVPDGGALPAWPAEAARILVAAAALALLLVAARGARRADPVARSALAVAILASGAFLAASPLAGPGRLVVEAGAGLAGAPASWLVEVSTPEDVGPWIGRLRVAVRLVVPFALTMLAAAAALAGIAAIASRPGAGPRRRPVLAAAWLWAIAGGVVLAHAALRIPIGADPADLLEGFRHDVLPRIAMDVSVLRHDLDAAGSTSAPVARGIAIAIALLAPALAVLSVIRKQPADPAAGSAVAGVVPVALALAAVLIGRAALVAFGPAEAASPAAALPASLVAALVASASVAWRAPGADGVAAVAAGLALLSV